MTDRQKEILKYWYAYIYERDEDETEIISCGLKLLGDTPQNILEAACGGAKLAAPLAEAGHCVTGFDIDEAMLHYARERAGRISNLHIYNGDALTEPWGRNFDAVILGTNLMLNIVTDWDYQQAQKRLVSRAYEALRPGGHLWLDFDCPDAIAASMQDRLCFEGTDDRGTYGQYFVLAGSFDEKTRVESSGRRYIITAADGEKFVHETRLVKHFPTLEQVCGWLNRTGFTIELLHGGHNGEPFDSDHRRAVIWARKI